MTGGFTRRGAIGAASAALLVSGCGREAESREAPPPRAGAGVTLKSAAPFPVGAAIRTDLLADTAYAALVRAQFDQVTADWEMKMERLIPDGGDGPLDFTAADRIAAFARENGLRLFGHTLIWKEQSAPRFERLKDDRRAFERAFGGYIATVAGRYAGQTAGWDVVNEPFDWNGERSDGRLWAEVLGPDYIALAFQHARAADPGAVLFLNEYGLEAHAGKRRAYLNLAEDLLRRGVPLGGLGTQSHHEPGLDPKLIAPAMRDLASLGLPIHVSELDMSFREGGRRNDPELLQLQARLVGETAEAFGALPERQRFAFTTWGVRDRDSWLRGPDQFKGRVDRPLLFDDAGAGKPAFDAAVNAWAGRA